MQYYIGVKQVQAVPMTAHEAFTETLEVEIPNGINANDSGYLVRYPDGYESWSPKETFESAYLAMGADNDGTTISSKMVEDFFVMPAVNLPEGHPEHLEDQKMGEKTHVRTRRLINGYEITESAACVDPKNYNPEIGAGLCDERIKNKVWELLGFLLQCARNGFTK